jgi:large subunit ribosomal protein L21
LPNAKGVLIFENQKSAATCTAIEVNMTYAIVATAGKQFRVEPGRFYDVDRIHAEPDTTLTLDQVLLVQEGETIQVGQPLVAGATVSATVMQHLRGRKIIVYKMRPKKKTRKKQGHRQELTRLMINSIDVGGAAPKAKEATKETKASAKAAKAE